MDENKRFWNRMAKLYTPMQERSNAALYGDIIACCKPYLNPESRVLELACGTGQFTFSLCDRVKSWEATDFSSAMIREAGKRSKGRIHFAVQDATALTYADSGFDAVLIANALHIMPEPEKALSEIRRVLKPHGLLLAPTFVYEGQLPRLRLWLLARAGFRTYHKWTARSYCSFLEQAGFEIVENRLMAGEPLQEALVIARKK